MRLVSGGAALAAALLLAGCDLVSGGGDIQEAARKTIEADEARQAKAREVVQAKLPTGAQASFRDVYSYYNRGAYHVCGTVEAQGAEPAAQRFIVKADGTALLEGEGEAADFARQAEDLCRTYSDGDTDSAPSAGDMGI